MRIRYQNPYFEKAFADNETDKIINRIKSKINCIGKKFIGQTIGEVDKEELECKIRKALNEETVKGNLQGWKKVSIINGSVVMYEERKCYHIEEEKKWLVKSGRETIRECNTRKEAEEYIQSRNRQLVSIRSIVVTQEYSASHSVVVEETDGFNATCGQEIQISLDNTLELLRRRDKQIYVSKIGIAWKFAGFKE